MTTSNKGMKLTGALPRSARRHGRRPQLIPGVLRTSRAGRQPGKDGYERYHLA